MTDIPPAAPAGWYPVPGGGKRFWDGRMWSTNVIGAPSREAEFEGLNPELPPPNTTLVLAPKPPRPVAERRYQSTIPQRAGWYTGPTGAMQWWDGRQWGPFAPAAAAPLRPAKDVGIAYLFLLLLGGFAAHRFYVGRVGSAVTFLILWWLGWILTVVAIGVFMVVAAVIWWIVDLFLLPSLVREANARALAPGSLAPMRPL